jgi:neutral ceramidase
MKLPFGWSRPIFPIRRPDDRHRDQRMRALISAASLVLCLISAVRGGELQAGASASPLDASDSMVIGGGIGPHKVVGQEGELRASALVLQDPHGAKAALIACDVLMINRDILDQAARRIEQELGVPFDHILINATHTHSAPTTVTVHGYTRDESFTRQVGEKIVAATLAAAKRLGPVTMYFRLGEESSVGRNSRLLLADGTIFWTGSHDDVVRPTGPFDPELPVWAFRRPDNSLEAVMFNHSTHTIGTHKPGVRSPAFYGMAAQSLEKQKGGTFLFFEGASGSTHNLDLLAPEMTLRIREAVTDALGAARPRPVTQIKGIRGEFTYKVRHFDDVDEDRAVTAYCTKRIKDPKGARFVIDTFRDMREKLSIQQGHSRKTWVQAISIGDTAVVGVPGEFFTVLGQDIKRRSPYRHTYIFELSNDYIGYIPDRRAFALGGYQVWTGLHSFVEPGTGEAIVAESIKLLDQLHTLPQETVP